uniref:DUF4772 domain-containing protein n=1 Tax=Oncorhynchus tshawytscha TaxID=74940 RepID=A0A8C8CBD3_ONCTS
MHTRRLVKRSILGSRVYAPSPTGDGAPLTGLVQAVKQENRDVSTGPRRNVYTVLMQDGSLKEFSEDEIAVGFNQTTAKGPLKSSLKQSSSNGRGDGTPNQGQNGEANSLSPDAVEGERAVDGRRTGRTLEGPERDHTRSVSLLDQKRKVVSSSIDVPHARKSEEEVDMDKVTAAMVLTSLSSSPLVRSPPVKVSEGLNGSWKESGGGFTPPVTAVVAIGAGAALVTSPTRPPPPHRYLQTASSPSACPASTARPPTTPSTNRMAAACSSTSQSHASARRNCDSDCSDGEEDFYYSEIKLNTDSVADGLSSLSPVSPSVLSPISPPHDHHRRPPAEGSNGTNGNKDNHSHTHSNSTPLSRSAPSALYLIHAEHAYQATAPVTIPFSGSAASGSAASTSFTPSSSSTFSISWQSPPVTFTGTAASPTHSRTQSFGEQRSQTIAVLSSPPRATGSLSRKSRGEGKKCRKVYGMENRDMWCTACRWKKACQRFTD